MQIDEVSKLIAKRRSIKPATMDADREISHELWQKLFEAANWAPNHRLTEPWRFTVFAGDARKEVGEALQVAYKEATPESEFQEIKYEKMAKNPFMAHAVVAIVMERDPKESVPEVEEVAAVASAVQNLHLAASSVGLGVFWSSPPATYAESFANFLGLKEGSRCLGLLYVGWPKEGTTWPTRKGSDAMAKVVFK
ncbi:nitroreductase [Rubritalea spongiae]|uniref:Putative NAD(P)H nitroreductase n=1 Tax=Rubritalea spongiae TaxID=430797 RepID=A0ABW5E2J5_9BACT